MWDTGYKINDSDVIKIWNSV